MKTITIGQIAEIEMGTSPEGSSYNSTGEGFPLLNGPTEFTNSSPVPVQWTTKPTKFCCKGDILFCVRGSSTGRMNIADQIYVLGRGVAAIRAKSNSNTHFIRSVLELRTAELLRKASGSTFPSVDRKAIGAFEVGDFPADEQIEIARILGVWDAAVGDITQLIAAKTQLKRGLMQQLLTGERRFAEFVQSDEKHKTPCGVLPYDWPMMKLSDVFQVVQRKNRGATKRVLTASGQHGMVDQRTYFNRSVSGASIAEYYLLEKGEFAYNRSSMKGYPFGAIKRLNVHDKGAVSTLYLCFALKHPTSDSDFWMHFFEGGLLNGQLRGIAQMGARSHGLLNVTNSDFFAAVVPMLTLEEQQRIADVLDAATREITLLKEQLDALKTQKRGLMQRLLSGDIRVTGEAATSPEDTN